MKKTLVFFLFLLSLANVFSASYEIEAYDIAIKAEKDGTLKIRETLDVRFLQESHGIYRDIQYVFENPDGNSFDDIKAEVSNISATSLYKSEREDGVLRLTLGDPKKYASERERYVIEYDYRLDYNRTEGYDELYYNIISPAWDTTIKNITWSLTLPSPVESNRISVTEGKEGSTRKGEFTLGRNNTTIEGAKDLLLPWSAITLRVEMDKGYWKGWAEAKDNSRPYVIASSCIALAFSLLSLLLWTKYGKDEKLDSSGARKLPPLGINPLEAGFIIDQTSSPEKEGFAMIFKWAEEGRLTCEEIPGKFDKKKPSYKFTRIKGLDDGAKESERVLFDSVFFKDEVTVEEMAEHGFSNDFAGKVVRALSKEMKGTRERKSTVVQAFSVFIAIGVSIASGILFSMKHPGALSVLMALSFLVPAFTVALVLALWAESGKIWKKSTFTIAFTILALIVAAGAVVLLLLSNEAKLSRFNTISAFASYFLVLIGAAFSALMDKRSEEGNEMLKECLEYRNYLSLLLGGEISPDNQDKEMWGTHMAYALAMGLDVKNEKMNMDMPQPIWFCGTGWNGSWLTYYLIFHSCSSTYATSVLNTSHSTTPGGGFSGGGFSGGGFSGGGGGSW